MHWEKWLVGINVSLETIARNMAIFLWILNVTEIARRSAGR